MFKAILKITSWREVYIKGKVRISSIVFPVIWYLLTKPVRTVVIDYVKGDRK